MIRAIIFLGLPASGKGTQAEIIAQKLGAVYFRASQIIQERFEKYPNEEDVIRAKKKHNEGELIPPEILVKWTLPEIEKLLKENKKIIFDGAFRTIYETKITFSLLEKFLSLNQIKAFFLNISESTAIKRSSTRKTCESCKRPVPYNDKTKDLKICPTCGGKLSVRADEKTIHNRLIVYKRETLPVLNYFREKNILEEIDGEPAIEEVTKEIMKRLTMSKN